MSYRLLVLPERRTLSPGVLQKIKELVEAGATVVGPRPQSAPGLTDYPHCDAEVEKVADELGARRMARPRTNALRPRQTRVDKTMEQILREDGRALRISR
jgi:hypothetical protein